MKELIINKELKWLDIFSPAESDIKYLQENFNFHPIVLDELICPSTRGKVENYEDYLYIVAYLPNYDPKMRSSRQAEIDILATKEFLITVHYEKLEPLEQFGKLIFDEKLKSHFVNTGQLIYYLLGEINKFSLRQLRHIEENVKKINEDLFKNKERELLEEISYVKRDLAAFGIIVRPQQNILESLIDAGTNFWGEKMKIYFIDVLGDHSRVILNLNNLKETLDAFEQTNSQLLNFKTNEVMKLFTILAFLTFPIILFVSIFQIDIVGNFFQGNPFYALALLGLVIAASITLIIICRKRKWL
jgi:magnesium transporter